VFTHQQLQEDREQLLKIHARTTRSLKNRLLRKLERLVAMVRNPVLISDWFEVRKRRKTYFQRVRSSEWSYAFERDKRDKVALQVPEVKVD
jgi:hypothetical protein